MKKILLTLFATALAALLGAAAFVWSGIYNVAADAQHLQPVYDLLERAMQQSVRLHARGIEAPALDAPRMAERGALHYRDHCVQCHGAPGVAPDALALGMTPVPNSLIATATIWRPRELYWIIYHGIKMSGMPAWRYRMPDSELWELVAFLERLPTLSASDYRALVRPEAVPLAAHAAEAPGARVAVNAERGRSAMAQYSCHGCHVIPGIAGSDTHVGPPLGGIASRQTIAGAVPNTFDQMVRWLRDPQAIDPLTAMPDLGVNERDARDMAAYLATLR